MQSSSYIHIIHCIDLARDLDCREVWNLEDYLKNLPSESYAGGQNMTNQHPLKRKGGKGKLQAGFSCDKKESYCKLAEHWKPQAGFNKCCVKHYSASSVLLHTNDHINAGSFDFNWSDNSALVSRVTGFHLSGEWMWIDNSVVDYTNWNTEEHMSSCVEIVSDSGKWRTNACNKYKSYICKMPKGRPSLISCDIFIWQPILYSH